jgi:osmotically-inducible protein OsmY
MKEGARRPVAERAIVKSQRVSDNRGMQSAFCRTLGLYVVLLLAGTARGGDVVQLDPFAQATAGMAACPAATPRVYTPEQMRTEAHVRVERGTRCALEGTCEPGGAYARDAEINEHVRAAIAADKRFANTSIWVTTSRKWVTLEGCVRSAAQRKALARAVSKQPAVERVFSELRVGASR